MSLFAPLCVAVCVLISVVHSAAAPWRTSIDTTWPATMTANATRASVGDGWDYGTVVPRSVSDYRSLIYNRNPTCFFLYSREYAFSLPDQDRCAKIWTQFGFAANHPSPSRDAAFRFTFPRTMQSVRFSLRYKFDHRPFCDLSDGIIVSFWIGTSQKLVRTVPCGFGQMYFHAPLVPQGTVVYATTNRNGNDDYDTNYLDLVIEEQPGQCTMTNISYPVGILFASYGPKDVTSIVAANVVNKFLVVQAVNTVFTDTMFGEMKKLTVALNNGSVFTYLEGTPVRLGLKSTTCMDVSPEENCKNGTWGTSPWLVYAQYGPLDVTNVVKGLIASHQTIITASNGVFTDPLPNAVKTLFLVLNDGQVLEFVEGSAVNLTVFSATSCVSALGRNGSPTPTPTPESASVETDEPKEDSQMGNIVIVVVVLGCLLLMTCVVLLCILVRSRLNDRAAERHRTVEMRESSPNTDVVVQTQAWGQASPSPLGGAVVGVPVPAQPKEGEPYNHGAYA